MTRQERWERDALDALQAHGRAMRRAEAPSASHPTDPERAVLDDRVRTHMARHPDTSYSDALDEVARASPASDPAPEAVEVDRERQALDRRVMAFAATHQLPYADALERVLSES